MNTPFAPDGPEQTPLTAQVVGRYHLCWKRRDLDGVMALYHPQVRYQDFFQNRVLGLHELREYVQGCLPHRQGEDIVHNDRIRVDGCTAFIQYQVTVQGGAGLVAFQSSEAITVRDGLIWRVNEYATLVRQGSASQGSGPARPAISRLGLSPRQLSTMAQDLEHYFQQRRPYLDPGLDLQRVASESGYSRNQISYLLNQVLGQSFYRYVNHARVLHLLDELQTPTGTLRIDELAFAAGFNSLSAFYKSFRDHTGLSPTAYLRQMRARP
ncbi:helix-turn-helix domain-containing protein [Pseudomonas sp. S75]|uniref:AraC family transcriptional regulator n=1 Tax=unclassified Pseudomonas TaxID=196821 RepID=UPI001907BE40|nr:MULTISPECIES: nuclear transport factor 2 family protein [unclassified Pseudomonas]MBJ9976204.1 helix-turn-helix domain-containing protein [Pseudomonas sp. S30]MBK0155175.1 helix-turn-helix domain-containing protein [Pseudomonas sp. S75]